MRMLTVLWLILFFEITCVNLTKVVNSTQENIRGQYREGGLGERVTLSKCPGSNVEQDFVVIPHSLRAPHSFSLLQKLTRSSAGLFNFTLTHSLPILCDVKYYQDVVFHKINLKIVKRVLTTFGSPSQVDLDVKGSLSGFKSVQNYFTTKGFLKNGTEYFNPHSYCVSKITGDEIEINACPPNCKERKEENANPYPCIAKCCPMGMVAFYKKSIRKFTCIESSEWRIYLQNNTEDTYTTTTIYPHYQYAGPSLNVCPLKVQSQQLFHPEEENDPDFESTDIRILTTGELLMRRSGNDRWDSWDVGSLFCTDGLYYKESTMDKVDVSNFSHIQGQVVIHCQRGQPPEPKTETLRMLYFATLCTAAVPLLIIVIIYGVTWDLQNVHGRTAATFCFSMLLSFVCTALAYATGLFHFVQIPSDICIAIGASAHFFYIASFTWMTVLNFDMWATIRSSTAPSGRSKGRKKFLVYCGFGFGLPTVIVSIAVFMETQFGLQDARVIRPQYGVRVCHLDSSAFFPYAIIPTIILYILNMLFAILIFRTLRAIKMQTQKFSDSNTTKASKSQVRMFVKLFILMGVSWIFEIVSWLVVQNNPDSLWAVFDLFNILQAFTLFWIFLCKPEIRVQLSQKFDTFDRFFKWTDSIRGKPPASRVNSSLSSGVTKNSRQTQLSDAT